MINFPDYHKFVDFIYELFPIPLVSPSASESKPRCPEFQHFRAFFQQNSEKFLIFKAMGKFRMERRSTKCQCFGANLGRRTRKSDKDFER